MYCMSMKSLHFFLLTTHMLYVMVASRGQIEERSESINLFFAELTCELSNNRIKELKLSYQVFADILYLLYLKLSFHKWREIKLLARYHEQINRELLFYTNFYFISSELYKQKIPYVIL